VSRRGPASEDRRGSVLVVDDEPTIAEVVARYLDRAGYETRVAGTDRVRSSWPAPTGPTSWSST
jgi:PleD family two-component response regulator